MSSINYETANEIVTLTDEEEKARREVDLTKRQRKFIKNTEFKTEVHFEGGVTQQYKNKKGEQLEFDVLESDALYYMMYDQPSEPQITANARSSKSGRPRLSDEA